MFVAGLSMYGALLLLPLYYQQVRGASALAAGLLMVPQGVGSLLPRTVAGRLIDRTGPRPVVLTGMTLAALGTVPFALAGVHTNEVLLSAALLVRGAGLAAATIAVMAGAFTGLAAVFDRTFWWAIAFTAAGALPALLLRRPAPPPAEPPRA
jgi:MFS family permease